MISSDNYYDDSLDTADYDDTTSRKEYITFKIYLIMLKCIYSRGE